MFDFSHTKCPGISNLIHHTFVPGLKSISHILYLPFHQNRITSLRAMKMYVEHAGQPDIIPQLRTIMTILSTVKSIEKNQNLVNREVSMVKVFSRQRNNTQKSIQSIYLSILICISSIRSKALYQ
jgi:hypothetical protein